MKCITQLISLCFLALIWMGSSLPVAVNSAGMTGHFRLEVIKLISIPAKRLCP